MKDLMPDSHGRRRSGEATGGRAARRGQEGGRRGWGGATGCTAGAGERAARLGRSKQGGAASGRRGWREEVGRRSWSSIQIR